MNQTATPSKIHARWEAMSPRDQRLVWGALFAAGLALVWAGLVGPPLRVLSQAPAQKKALDLQMQRMRFLQGQAHALRQQAQTSPEEALRALAASTTQHLGASARLNIVNDRASVTLSNTPAASIATWLAEVRLNAHALPVEARMTRRTAAPPAATNWDGEVVLDMPANARSKSAG